MGRRECDAPDGPLITLFPVAPVHPFSPASPASAVSLASHQVCDVYNRKVPSFLDDLAILPDPLVASSLVLRRTFPK